MISMAYGLAKISMTPLMRRAFGAGVALTRLDERISRSPVGAGFLERQNFADACASLWIDGQLVHLEDLVLHDAFRDTRTPTHELTIARDLAHRRRIGSQPAVWALSEEGLRGLRQARPAASLGEGGTAAADKAVAGEVSDGGGEGRSAVAIKAVTSQKARWMPSSPPSMPSWRARRRRSKRPRSRGAPKTLRKRIPSSTISTGMRTSGWRSGRPC
jgi:hypothetical protein